MSGSDSGGTLSASLIPAAVFRNNVQPPFGDYSDFESLRKSNMSRIAAFSQSLNFPRDSPKKPKKLPLISSRVVKVPSAKQALPARAGRVVVAATVESDLPLRTPSRAGAWSCISGAPFRV
jgi:hypothetical protein